MWSVCLAEKNGASAYDLHDLGSKSFGAAKYFLKLSPCWLNVCCRCFPSASPTFFKIGSLCSLGYCFLGVSLPTTVTLPPVTTATVSDSDCACAISGKGGKHGQGDNVYQDGSGGRIQVLCTANRDHRIWPSVQCNHRLKWQRKVKYSRLHLLSPWDIQLVSSRPTHWWLYLHWCSPLPKL